jgi:hypothetical protein
VSRVRNDDSFVPYELVSASGITLAASAATSLSAATSYNSSVVASRPTSRANVVLNRDTVMPAGWSYSANVARSTPTRFTFAVRSSAAMVTALAARE